jgi:catechol 2,3-dioxygenase-like lactoylglutathione lyase family enzyme
MKQYLSQIALVVRDYDEAIDFYTNKLNFILLEDTKLSDTKDNRSASWWWMWIIARERSW